MTEKELDIAIEKCERIMEMDARTMQNPVSENGWIFEKVYDLLQYLRQFQFATDTNVGGNLIDRQAAISEIMEDLEDRSLHDDPATPEDFAEGYDEGIRNAAAIVLQMPSAQPGCEDAVYRKAVQMLLAYFVPEERYAEAVDGLRRLPSAQPVEDARAMCGECDAWNKYKNYPQPEQFNPCTVCQEFDCTGCKFRRT